MIRVRLLIEYALILITVSVAGVSLALWEQQMDDEVTMTLMQSNLRWLSGHAGTLEVTCGKDTK